MNLTRMLMTPGVGQELLSYVGKLDRRSMMEIFDTAWFRSMCYSHSLIGEDPQVLQLCVNPGSTRPRIWHSLVRSKVKRLSGTIILHDAEVSSGYADSVLRSRLKQVAPRMHRLDILRKMNTGTNVGMTRRLAQYYGPGDLYQEMSRCLKLRVLRLARIMDLSILFESIASSGTRLERVSLHSCKIKNTQLQKLFMCSRQSMLHLSISYGRLLSNMGLRFIGEELQQLQTLQLNRIVRLKDEGIGHIRHLKDLRILHILGNTSITDRGVRAMLGLHPGLPIDESPPRTWKISDLNLRGCERLTDTSVSSLLCLPSLTELNLAGLPLLTDAALKVLGSMKGLRHLDISHSNQLTDVGLAHLKGLNLGILNISNGSFTDRSLRHLEHMNLSELDISMNGPNMTGRTLHCVCKASLRKLNMSALPQLQDTCLADVAKRCTRLEGLNLNNCGSITEKGLRTVSMMGSLRALGISNNSNLSDLALRYLARLKHLTDLDLSGSLNVSTSGLVALAEHSFRRLNLSFNPRLSAEALSLLRKTPPRNVVVTHTMIPFANFSID